MENVHKCTSVLSPLIAEAKTSAMPLAENAINEMVAMTPAPQQRDALESVRSVVKAHGDAAGSGSRCDFADAVNDYIEKLMRVSYDSKRPATRHRDGEAAQQFTTGVTLQTGPIGALE